MGYRCLGEDPDFEYLRIEIYPYGQNQSKLFMFSFLSRKMANNILLEIKNNCGDLFLSKDQFKISGSREITKRNSED